MPLDEIFHHLEIDDTFSVTAKPTATGYTLAEVRNFLKLSNINQRMSFVLKIKRMESPNTRKLLEDFTKVIENSENVTIAELQDFYVLAYMMGTYKNYDFMHRGPRVDLSNAVCFINADLSQDQVDYIVMGAYKKLVFGNDTNRTKKMLNVLNSVTQLAMANEAGRNIALGILTLMFKDSSGVKEKKGKQTTHFTCIKEAFDHIKLVDWKKLNNNNNNVHKMFVIIKTFSFITSLLKQHDKSNEKEIKEMADYFCDLLNQFDSALQQFMMCCVIRNFKN